MSESESIDRHEALEALSRDHHEALVQAKRLQEGHLGGEDPESVTDRQVARAFLSFWDNHARRHFREEEDVLLPVYSRHEPPSENELIRTMIDDHAWFRDVVEDLRQLIAGDVDADTLRSLLDEIGARLQQHARMEERELFEMLQNTLTEQDLHEVHHRSRAYRNGGDGGAVGRTADEEREGSS